MKKSISASSFMFGDKHNKQPTTSSKTNKADKKESTRHTSKRREREDETSPVSSKKPKPADSDDDEIDEPLSLPSSAKDEQEDGGLLKVKLKNGASQAKNMDAQVDSMRQPFGNVFITKLRKTKQTATAAPTASKSNLHRDKDRKQSSSSSSLDLDDDADVLNFTGMEEICKSSTQRASTGSNSDSDSNKSKRTPKKPLVSKIVVLDSDDDDFEVIPAKKKKAAKGIDHKPVTNTLPQKTARSPMASKFRFNTSNTNNTAQSTISIAPSRSLAPRKKAQNDNSLWIDKHQPKNEQELAVHTKKIAAVRDWLQTSLRDLSTNAKNPARMLVLTGPCGAGKTALVRVLAAELGCELCEWINPPHVITKDALDKLTTPYTPRLLEFRKWLRFASLSTGLFATEKKVILIEDLPFLSDTGKSQEFREIIRDFLLSARHPLVFILSDTYMGNSAINMILTPDILSNRCVHSISVNPVNNTEAKKALSRIATSEGHQISQDDLVQVFESNEGDIRAAINALQFLCIDQVPDEEVKNSKTTHKGKAAAKKGKDKKATKAAKQINTSFLGARDLSISIFHAIGKILYNKRLPDPDGPPPNFKPEYHRAPMKSNPEEVIDKIYVEPTQFNMFLHQNYPDFFTDIDDVVEATQYLSESDTFARDWKEAPSLSSFISSVATRGFLYSNTHPDSDRKFKPFYKPQAIEIMRKAQANGEAARQLMEKEIRNQAEADKDVLHPAAALSMAPPTVLFTELLPFMHRLATNARSVQPTNFSYNPYRNFSNPNSNNHNNYNNANNFHNYNNNSNYNNYNQSRPQATSNNYNHHNSNSNYNQNNNPLSNEYAALTNSETFSLLNSICGYKQIQAYLHVMDKNNKLEKWYVDEGDPTATSSDLQSDICDDNTHTAHDKVGEPIVDDIED